MKFCPYCGTELPIEDGFCPSCGKATTSKASAIKSEPKQNEAYVTDEEIIKGEKTQTTMFAIASLLFSIAMLIYPFIDIIGLFLLVMFFVSYFVGLTKLGKFRNEKIITKEEFSKSTAFKLLISACCVFCVGIIIKAIVLFVGIMGGACLLLLLI